MRFFKFFLITSLFLALLLVVAKPVRASEGIIELKSTSGQAARCFVLSAYMADGQFSLLTVCRDLIYPSQPTALIYTLWAAPMDGGNPIKLGELGVGKILAKSKEPFTGLFVTNESNTKARQPEGPIVMQGPVQAVPFLQGVPAFEPTPTLTEEEQAAQPTPAKKTTADRFKSIQGVLQGVFIFVLIGLVLVVFVPILFKRGG
jgi:hypothetical protein